MELSDLRDRLICALSGPGYGLTATEVLLNCQLVVQAEDLFNEIEISEIQKELNISRQTWRRMLFVGSSQILWELRSKLPKSFAALYRISLLKPTTVYSSVRDGSINQETTTRSIEKIAKRERINSHYRLSNRQVFFFAEEEISDDEFNCLIEEINKIANHYRCCFDTENLDHVRNTDRQYQYNKRVQEIQSLIWDLVDNLELVHIIYGDPDESDDKHSLIDEIVHLPFKDFVDHLMSESLTRREMMENYGLLYCAKIAFEYLRAKDRSQRYNYKRRLLEVKEKYPDLQDDVVHLYGKYIEPWL